MQTNGVYEVTQKNNKYFFFRTICSIFKIFGWDSDFSLYKPIKETLKQLVLKLRLKI